MFSHSYRSVHASIAVQWGWGAALALLIATSVFTLTQDLVRVPFTISFDANEGWNAANALRVMEGQSPYKAMDDIPVSSYPPVSFYVVGYIGKLVGDNVIAGRILSTMSLVSIGIIIFLMVKRTTSDWLCASIGCFYFLGFMATYFSRYVGIDDPHLFAQSIMLVGLLCVFGNWDHPKKLTLALLLFLIAGLTKQTLLAVPLAVILVIATDYRNRLLFVLIIGTALVFAGIVALMALFDMSIINSIASGKKAYNVGKLITFVVTYSLPLQATFIFSTVICIVQFQDSNFKFVLFYLCTSLLFGSFFSGGAGSDINHFFDVIIAISLGLGLGLYVIRKRVSHKLYSTRLTTAAALLPLLLISNVLMQAAFMLKHPRTVWNDLIAQERTSVESINFLQQQTGPALCENVALCYWSGQQFEIVYWSGKDFQRSDGSGPNVAIGNAIVNKVRQKHFGIVQVGNNRELSLAYRFPQGFFEALDENYELQFTNKSGQFYVPKNH